MLSSLTRRATLAGLGGAALALTAGRAVAARSPAPDGAVILTIAGDITHANRGALEPKLDGFLHFHEIDFDRAFTLDRAMLEALPQGEIRCQPPQYSSPVAFTGPLLAEVLKMIGAEGASLQTRALDGFAVDLSAAQLAEKDWRLTMRADGRSFGIGDKGPLWLMHTPSAITVPEEEEQSWPWALFFIRVTK